MDKDDRRGRAKRRKRFLLFLLPLLLFFIVFTACLLLIQTPAFINGLGSVLEGKLGYRVTVQGISISPGIKGEVSDLNITRLKDGGLSFLCAHAVLESSMSRSLKGEVESIRLTQPKLFFTFGEKKGKTDLSFLEKLPSVQLLTIQKGKFELSFISSSQLIKLVDIDLRVEDFSPNKGGKVTFSSRLRIISGDENGMEGSGWCKGYLNLDSLFPRPLGRGSVEFHIDSGSYQSASLENLVLEVPINLEEAKLDIDVASLVVDSLTYKREGRDTTLRDIGFQSSFRYYYQSHEITSSIVKGTLSNLGSFKGSFKGTLKGDFPWRASLEASSMKFEEFFSLLRPYIPSEYQEWVIKGKGDIETNIEGNYADQRLAWTGNIIFSFSGGEFSSPDWTKAGQGITGRVILKIRSSPPDKKVDFQLSSEVGEGEFLWGKYYKDFSGKSITFSSLGGFFLTSPPHLEFQSSLDVFDTGNYSLSGLYQRDEALLYVKAGKISHQKVFSLLLEEYISQNVPSLKGIHLGGDSDLYIKVIKRGEAFYLEGILEMENTSLRISKGPFSIGQLDLMLPFDLVYPSSSDFKREKGERFGSLTIKTLQMDKMQVEDLSIPLILSHDALSIPEDIEIPIFGGRLEVIAFIGSNILSPLRQFRFALKMEQIDLSAVSQKLKVEGTPSILEADFPVITYQQGRLSAQGKTVAKIFGGVVEATNLSARDLFSQSRKVGGDIVFEGINLEKVTEKINIGKMAGIIRGSIKNLEIEYGQPSRFILDVESVKTKGVKQKISVDAIDNISVIGTGSEDMGRVLNQGIRRFFKEYPYSRIGIRCTLENDRFSVRGKILEGGSEYLVRRAFLRGVDVVNQNPQNTISFKDMQERIKRIFRAREERAVKNGK